jgi:hypothetical protein
MTCLRCAWSFRRYQDSRCAFTIPLRRVHPQRQLLRWWGRRSVAGVHADYLLRTPVIKQVDQRVQQERSRLDAAPGPKLSVDFRRWPTTPLVPGASCRLSDGERFNAEGVVLPQPFANSLAHVLSIQATAQATGQKPDDCVGSDRAGFAVVVAAQLIPR